MYCISNLDPTSLQCDCDCEGGVDSARCFCVCPSVLSLSPSPLSICVLWAANVVENGLVFPPVSCYQPVFMSDCVLLPTRHPHHTLPLNLCRWSNCQGSSEHRWGLSWEGRVRIHHQSLALGRRTNGYPANSLPEKIAGEVSSRRACWGFSLSFSFFVSLGLSPFYHTVSIQCSCDSQNTSSDFGEMCGLQLQKYPSDYLLSECHSLMSVNFQVYTDKKKHL